MKSELPDIIILAGGFGTRLQSIVKEVPKPMAPIAEKPFLHWLLKYLITFNPKQFILSTGYMHEVIENYFGNSFEGIPVVYSQETEPLGTGGAIKKAMSLVNTEDALVLNGDTFLKVNHHEFYQFHIQQEAIFSMVLKPMDKPTRYGTVACKLNTIEQFNEKNEHCDFGLINTGVYLMNKMIDAYLPENEKFSFEKEFLEVQTQSLNMQGFKSDAYFIDIGIPEDFHRANNEFKTLFHSI